MSWSRLQSASHGATASTTVTATLPNNAVAGSKIIAFIASTITTAITSVQDAALNSLTVIEDVSGSAGGNTQCAVYAMDTPAGDVGIKPAITVTGVTADWSVLVMEVSGLAAGNTLAAMVDGTPAGVQETPTTSQAQPAYRTSTAGEFLVSFLGDNGNSVTYALAGYTLDVNSINGNANNDVVVGYKSSTGAAESGTWTTSGTPTGSGLIVAAFKLAATGPLPAAPGQAWRRYFKHRQQQAVSYAITAPSPPVVTPAPLYPLAGPVRARLAPVPPGAGSAAASENLDSSGLNGGYGRVFSNAGTYSGAGPAVIPQSAAGPVSARRPPPFLRGRVISHGGMLPGTGPFQAPLQAPAGIGRRAPGPLLHGRVISRQGAYSGAGPVLPPVQGPVSGPIGRRGPPPRGHVLGVQHAGTFTPAAPVTGPQLYPLHGPVQARQPLPAVHGRAMTMVAIVIIFTGPPVTPLPQPVAVRVVPVRTGHTQSSATLPSGHGPAFRQASQPFRAPFPPMAGRGRGHGGTAPGVMAPTGPQLTPLHAPVRSRFPLPPRHPVLSGRGTFAGAGQPLTSQARQPWGVRLSLVRTGHFQASPAPPVFVSPLYPLHGPVKARPQSPVLHGRARGSAGAFTFVPPPVGPQLYPLHGPVHAPFPQAPYLPGRAMTMAAFIVPGIGPVPPPLHQPVRALPVPPFSRGRASGNPGTPPVQVIYPAPLYPLHSPVRAPVPPVFSKGRVSGNPGARVVIVPAPLHPLHGPVRSPVPGTFSKGRATGSRGDPFVPTPAPLYPLHGPVRAPLPGILPPQGRVIRRAGTFTPVGSPVPPQAGPVTARRPQPARYGRGNGSPGRFNGSGPPARPLPGPVTARQPLPPRGHGGNSAGTFAGTGTRPKPLTTPVRARQPLPPRGTAQWHAGGPFVPPPPVEPPPATLYLTPGTIIQGQAYAATTIATGGGILTISNAEGAVTVITPAAEGYAPSSITPPPDSDIPPPDSVVVPAYVQR